MTDVTVVEEVVAGPTTVIEEVIYLGIPGATGGGGDIETVATGTVAYVVFSGVWPDRPTAREDIMVIWVGPDPSPAIVTPPSLAGMYTGDARFVPTE